MKRIWKYALEVADTQLVRLPEGAQLLTVQMQGQQPQLWALVNPEAPSEPREIAIYGTGSPLPDNPGKHLGTFQIYHGTIVLHAFAKV